MVLGLHPSLPLHKGGLGRCEKQKKRPEPILGSGRILLSKSVVPPEFGGNSSAAALDIPVTGNHSGGAYCVNGSDRGSGAPWRCSRHGLAPTGRSLSREAPTIPRRCLCLNMGGLYHNQGNSSSSSMGVPSRNCIIWTTAFSCMTASASCFIVCIWSSS